MNAHKNAGGIAVNWLVFGSSGHETRPEGGVLENFVMCSDKDFRHNHIIKTICDPLKIISMSQVHFPVYRRGYYGLNENGEIVTGSISREVHFSRIRINHYYTKSKEEFMAKIKRGRADLFVNDRTLKDFYDYDQNKIKDTEILERIPAK